MSQNFFWSLFAYCICLIIYAITQIAKALYRLEGDQKYMKIALFLKFYHAYHVVVVLVIHFFRLSHPGRVCSGDFLFKGRAIEISYEDGSHNLLINRG